MPAPQVKLSHILDIDYGVVEAKLKEFIKESVDSANVDGVVIGISGGVDSSVTFKLAVKALGPENVTALIMPDPLTTPKEDVEDARKLAESEGVKPHIINIGPLVEVYKATIPIYEDEERDKLALGNLRARIRMTLLYYYANKLKKLVLGTGDRSEILIGYFTKYGDGAVDVAPLAILYKTQVRRLAVHLGLPERIAFKPSSPRLWPGHVAEKELGVKYEDIDLVLFAHFDLGLEPTQIPEATGISYIIVNRVLELHRASAHKRSLPHSPDVGIVRQMMLKNVGLKSG